MDVLYFGHPLRNASALTRQRKLADHRGCESSGKAKPMNNDFVAEILRATGTLQSGDSAGVTAIIQQALAAGGLIAPTVTGNASYPPAPPLMAGGIKLSDAPSVGTYPQSAVRSPRMTKPLSEVLRTLTAGRKGLGLDSPMPGGFGIPVRAPDLPIPTGAEFRDSAYSCLAGSRRYRLYVPTSAGDPPRGLVVMLHGCTQNPEDFAAGTGMNALAEEHQLLVVYPAQTGSDNSMSCWNWFRPGDQTRDVGEPAILAGLTTSIRDEFGVPRDHVFIAGLSAGGAMAEIMARPTLFHERLWWRGQRSDFSIGIVQCASNIATRCGTSSRWRNTVSRIGWSLPKVSGIRPRI